MTHPSMLTPQPDFDVAQEDDTVASRTVSAVLAAGIVATVAAVAIGGWILSLTMARLPIRPSGQAAVAPREIAGIHQTLIERDRHGWELREQQRRSLDEYRWIDRGHGIAQIPIDRAMQMIIDDAKKGEEATP